jgi:hypothetical protein
MPDTADVIRVGAHIRVVGNDHPQAGKSGVISEILGFYLRVNPPRAVIQLDDKSGYIVVTLPYLQVIP